MSNKLDSRTKCHRRLRKKIKGTESRPRLCVFKSNKHVYAQIVNDADGITIAYSSTNDKALKSSGTANIKTAETIGKAVAQSALGKNVKQVVFDRGGYKYHGMIKALAEAARAEGLEF